MDYLIEIKDRLKNVVETEKYVRALCPFHEESEPSFYIFKNTNKFYCFGCKTSGSIEFLYSRLFGIILKPDENQIVLRNACDFYHSNLFRSTVVLDYLNKRGLTIETIKKFKIGFGNKITPYMERLGFSRNKLIEVGLIRKDGYEYMYNKIVFPIFKRNSVFSFVGRAIGEKLPKYVNCPTTGIFNKQIFLGEDFVQPDKPIYLVEGPFDAISLVQNGFNAVAILGSALTPVQCLKLSQLTGEAIVLLDNDPAGRKALLKICDQISHFGIIPFFKILPENIDVDELLLKNKKAFENLPLYNYHFEKIKSFKKITNLLEQSTKVNNFINNLRSIDNFIYVERILDLLAKELNLSRDTLQKQLDRYYFLNEAGLVYLAYQLKIKKNGLNFRLFPIKNNFLRRVLHLISLNKNPDDVLDGEQKARWIKIKRIVESQEI